MLPLRPVPGFATIAGAKVSVHQIISVESFGDAEDQGQPEERTWTVEFMAVNWARSESEIMADLRLWMKARKAEFITGERSDRRTRAKDHLRALGAFRVARHVAGGGELRVTEAIFAKASLLAGDALGRQFSIREAWARAVRETRKAIDGA